MHFSRQRQKALITGLIECISLDNGTKALITGLIECISLDNGTKALKSLDHWFDRMHFSRQRHKSLATGLIECISLDNGTKER